MGFTQHDTTLNANITPPQELLTKKYEKPYKTRFIALFNYLELLNSGRNENEILISTAPKFTPELSNAIYLTAQQ